MVTRAAALGGLLACASCTQTPFGEGPELDDECGVVGLSGGGGRNNLLELGTLAGETFIPVVGGEERELHLSGEPAGWGFVGAVRFQTFSGSPMPDQCAPVSVVGLPGGEVLARPFPVRWVDLGNGTGNWTSVRPALILVGDDLDALLAGPPPTIQVIAGIPNYSASTPPLTFTYVNREGFLAP